jgi:hypothetical protein
MKGSKKKKNLSTIEVLRGGPFKACKACCATTTILSFWTLLFAKKKGLKILALHPDAAGPSFGLAVRVVAVAKARVRISFVPLAFLLLEL